MSQEFEIGSIQIFMQKGRYYITSPQEEQVLLEMRTPVGRLSQTFEDFPLSESEFEPETVIDLIEQRMSQYIGGRKDEMRETIASMRAVLPQLTLCWFRQQADASREALAKAEKDYRRAYRTVRFVRQEMSGAAS